MATQKEKPFFSEEEITLISEHLLKGAPEFEIKRFLIVCERTKLDPFTRQIYGRVQYSRVKRRGTKDQYDYVPSVVIMTSIDGLRSIAEATGQYRGQTKPEWMFTSTETGRLQWQDAWTEVPPKFPDAARVGVHRHGFVEPCYGVARYLSYIQYKTERDGDGGRAEQKPTPFWMKMGDVMIAKCAEAIALRKAFPLLLGGIYIDEEVGRDEEPIEDAEPAGKAADKPDPDTIPVTVMTKATVAAPVEQSKAPDAETTPAASTEPAPKTTRKRAPKTETAAATEAKSDPPDSPFSDEVASAPVAETKKTKDGPEWRDYVIQQISVQKFFGKKLSELSAEDIDGLKKGWVDKYGEKFKDNPAKMHEAKMLLQAWEATK